MSLPPNVLSYLLSQTTVNHQSHMANVKANRNIIASVIRASAAKSFDELNPQQARAISKILALPKP